MNAIASKLVAGAIAVALLVAVLFYVRTLRTDLADANLRLDDARRAVAARDSTISALRTDATEKTKQQRQLDVSTDKVTAKLAAAREEIRKVIHENPTVRSWADTSLPDDVARLSASPAYAGADDFGTAVSNADALRHAGTDPAH